MAEAVKHEVFDEKAFDEFMDLAMKYKGPAKFVHITERVEFPGGIVFEPGHYRRTENGYEPYDPETVE